LRESTNAHPDGSALIEGAELRCGHDANEPWGKAALRRHEACRCLCQFPDPLGGADVLSEIEVVDPVLVGHLGDSYVQVIGKTRKHGVDVAEFSKENLTVRDINGLHLEGMVMARKPRVVSGHLESTISQQLRPKQPDLPKPKHSNSLNRS
jgi:hypothetical protein